MWFQYNVAGKYSSAWSMEHATSNDNNNDNNNFSPLPINPATLNGR